ncbi:hypothetical protein [uncultured Chitinophaga sp.]|jgi:hypothetical protein|uniref:hypothetical protein n=1 Tax=uncultured Chitinophaga sp. TaxID=339340 RepID=UPI0026099A78|nr:hypothetical protein [uncultured Chitinophaga sp.]
MNEKRGNIDNWLKTAAQQPGPGLDRKDEDEGWAGLSAMLDDDRKRPGIIAGATGTVSGWRRKRWLLLTLAAGVLTLSLLTFSLFFSNDTKVITDHTRPSSGHTLHNTTTGETNHNNRDNSADVTPERAPASTPAIIRREKTAEQPAGGADDGVPVRRPPAATTKESRADNQLSLQGAVHPLEPQKAAADMISVQHEAAAMEEIKTNGLSLQTLPLPRHHPLSLNGTGQQLPVTPAAQAAAKYPRWAIQAGFLATTDEGRGGRVSFLYRLPIRQHFYLQPYIGAAYTGGYDKQLGHVGEETVTIGSGQTRTDSVWTTYQVKHMWSADAGIRVGYTLQRFSVGAGVRYHHILHSAGDTIMTRKALSTPSVISNSQAFSKAAAPGKHSFYGELEANYQWRFGIITGISYQLLLHENASSEWQFLQPGSNSSSSVSTPGGWTMPVLKNSLQDKSRLEIYLRLPLKRK